MFAGSIPALLTPFRDGKIDEARFQAFIEWQIAEGSSAIVPCGTTGESATLSHDEHERVIDLAIEAAQGRVPVIAGAGSNATAEAISLTQHAQKAGADAVLSVCPYYNKPSQEGLYAHFRAVHDATDIPIVIYNIPGRSVVDMSVETMARLAELPRIVGVKDATNDLARPLNMRAAVGPEFCQLSGEDATAMAFNAQGGTGCISVTANIAPGLCAAMQAAWARGDMAQMTALRDRLAPLHAALFCETSPQPAKYAASRLGLFGEEVRLPLVPASARARAMVDAALDSCGLGPVNLAA